MAITGWAALPSELLEQILSHIAASSPSTLKAVSLLSRDLREHALPHIFQIFEIGLGSNVGVCKIPEKLPQAVTQHIRHLIVHGVLQDRVRDYVQSTKPSTRAPNVSDDELRYSVINSRHKWSRPSGSDEAVRVNLRDSPSDDAWRPLAALIHGLPHLTKFTFACENRFPQNVFDVLTTRHPSCTLCISFLYIDSLNDWERVQPGLSEYETALISSPALTDLGVIVQASRAGSRDYHCDAVFELVQSISPNLQSVAVIQLLGNRMLVSQPSISSQDPWQGLKTARAGGDVKMPPTRTRGALRRFKLVLTFRPDDLTRWSQATDFNVLRVLELYYKWAPQTLFESLARDCRGMFPRLTTLSLEIRYWRWEDTEPAVAESLKLDVYDRAVGSFLAVLPPLTYIKLIGEFGRHTIDILTDVHRTVQELELAPKENLGLTARELDLPARCSNLTRLDLKLTSFNGAASATAL